MNKQTLKVIILTVICTLAVVGVIGAIAIPKVIDEVKVATVTNFDDEYQELAYLLDESKEPVIQPNYIITGLIMSPDFQEYLDQGVQNGWWTKEFLEQFLIDEALPIFFTNWHFLFSLILTSDPVQELGGKVTIIKAKVEEIITTVKIKLNFVINLLNSPQMANVKQAIGTISANKGQIIGLINTLKSIDFSQVGTLVGKLQNVVDAINNIDINNIEASINKLISAVNSIPFDQLDDVIAKLQDIKDKLGNVDLDKIKAILDEVEKTISDIKLAVANLLESEFADKIRFILDHIEFTKDILQLIIDFVINHNEDVDADFDFNNPIKIPGHDPITDLQPLAPLLNVLDVEVEKTYDDNGTKLNQKDDVLTVTAINVGFEEDETIFIDVLSKDMVIKGKDAFKYNTAIGVLNKQV